MQVQKSGLDPRKPKFSHCGVFLALTKVHFSDVFKGYGSRSVILKYLGIPNYYFKGKMQRVLVTQPRLSQVMIKLFPLRHLRI
jgi:hypothetical protein